MANGLYKKFAEELMKGKDSTLAPNLDTGTIKAQIVDVADYTVNLTTHDYFDDIPAGARVGAATALANTAITNGSFTADPTVIAAVSGDPAEAVVIFEDTGVESTSMLIAYIDQSANFPVTPNGGSITLNWGSGSGIIFSL